MNYKPRSQGFSLIEVLVILSILAILVGIAIPTLSDVRGTADDVASNSNVATVNRAVQAYLASGGDLTGVTDPQAIIDKIKTRQAGVTAKNAVGFSGGFIDKRMRVQPSSVGTTADRVVWNASKVRFEVSSSGTGFDGFVLDERLGEIDYGTEERQSASFQFNGDDGWVWGYKEVPLPTVEGPSEIPTGEVAYEAILTPAPASSAAGFVIAPISATIDVQVLEPEKILLSPPLVEPAGGVFSAEELPLTAVLVNTNDEGISQVFYSLNGSEPTLYTSPFAITDDALLVTYAAGDPDAYKDSASIAALYQFGTPGGLPVLKQPKITLSSSAFSSEVTSISFTISNPNPNPSVTSQVYYTVTDVKDDVLPQDEWPLYQSGQTVNHADYPEGFRVSSYAKSKNEDIYNDSEVASRNTVSEFFGLPSDGNILFVLDASQNMSEDHGGVSRFEAAIKETIFAIQGLSENSKFNVAVFDAAIHWVDGTWTLHDATTENKEKIISKIKYLSHDGGSSYAVGLDLPFMFDPQPETVFFLSSGNPQGKYNKEIKKLKDSDIVLNGILMGDTPDDDDVLGDIAYDLGGETASSIK